MYYGEKLNSISHLVGAALALIGLGALLSVAIQTRDPWVITSFSVFGISMVLLYTMSTLYHSFSTSRLKNIFQLFDHITIYLLIAGTYTPYMLVTQRDANGWLIMGIIWSLAVAGILSDFFIRPRRKSRSDDNLPGHGLGLYFRLRQPQSCTAGNRIAMADSRWSGLHCRGSFLYSGQDGKIDPRAWHLAFFCTDRHHQSLHFNYWLCQVG